VPGPPRPTPRTSASATRRYWLRINARLDRVRAVVAHMDAVEGWGWPRRMELAGALDRDYPQVWLSGRKHPLEPTVRRLEDYAARFGFRPPPRDNEQLPVAPAAVFAGLDRAFEVSESK
jgi:hypothetical protein